MVFLMSIESTLRCCLIAPPDNQYFENFPPGKFLFQPYPIITYEKIIDHTQDGRRILEILEILEYTFFGTCKYT